VPEHRVDNGTVRGCPRRGNASSLPCAHRWSRFGPGATRPGLTGGPSLGLRHVGLPQA